MTGQYAVNMVCLHNHTGKNWRFDELNKFIHLDQHRYGDFQVSTSKFKHHICSVLSIVTHKICSKLEACSYA